MNKNQIAIRMLFSVFILCSAGISSTALADGLTEQLEKKYFDTLSDWTKRGGKIEEVQDSVVQPCGKLAMLLASAAEKARFLTIDRDEFNFRVDVCVKMTVNRVHPQPEFEKREVVEIICDESQKTLFKKLCLVSGLR